MIDCHLRFLPSFASLQDWREFLKLSIKEESIAFSHNKRMRLHKQQVSLTNKIIRLRQRLVDGDDTVSILISDTESQLKTLRVKEIEGIMIRSRAQWLEGKRPSCYFLNLQRIKAHKSHISSVFSKVLEFIVDPDQTCSVPGRKITSNLHILRDVLDYTDRTNETGILISLDQEKAFDRVNRTFLLNLLSRFGFGPSFCFWINTLYNGANMRIIVNEWLSDTIPLSRGVRQGDSLSPLLYILCVETLACKIRNNPDIEGFLLPGARGLCYKVGVYADDTTCIVKSYRSLQVLFNMINVYEGGSGARLNVAKTEAMWLGAWRSRGDQPLGLKWVTKMKILGVVFGLDTDADNWRPKLEKLEKHLNLWKSHSLSLVGKSLIINVLGISKLLYLSAVLCVPKWVISKINNLVWPFLWGSRIETVSRMTCHQSLGKGGLGIFDFQTKSDSLKLASLISIFDDRESKSFFLTKYFLGSRLAFSDNSSRQLHSEDAKFDTLLREMLFDSRPFSRDHFAPTMARFCFLFQEVLFSSLEREFCFPDSPSFLVSLSSDRFCSRPFLGFCERWVFRKL